MSFFCLPNMATDFPTEHTSSPRIEMIGSRYGYKPKEMINLYNDYFQEEINKKYQIISENLESFQRVKKIIDNFFSQISFKYLDIYILPDNIIKITFDSENNEVNITTYFSKDNKDYSLITVYELSEHKIVFTNYNVDLNSLFKSYKKYFPTSYLDTTLISKSFAIVGG